MPWQGIASMNISDKERANVASAVGVRRSETAAFSTMSSMPRPQDRGSAVASDCIPSRTVTASQSGYVPPHIRAKNRDSAAAITQSKPAAENLIDIHGDVKTVSSASNSYEDAWSSTGTLGPWSAVDTRRRNAFYAPQRPVEERTPSLHVAASASSQLIGRNGWAKPVSLLTYNVSCMYMSETDTFTRLEDRHHGMNRPSRRPRVIVTLPTRAMVAQMRCRARRNF